MKTSVAAFVALLFAAGLAGPANAANGKHARHSSDQNTVAGSERDGWYPHDASQLPFGSDRWWREKESEGSLGR
jgi:hypothetical protein